MLSHTVFITLRDPSDSAIRQLVNSCHKYLPHHAGVKFFGAGTLTPDLKRPVNDHDFDVAINVVFETRADHDAYQVSEDHLAFIAENKESWERVRIFDADVT